MKARVARWAVLATLIASGCSSPVVRHARDGSLPELQAALQSGRVKQKHLSRGLCEAASRGHAGAARLLLESGADIEGRPSRTSRFHGCGSLNNPCAKGLALPPKADSFKKSGYLGLPTPLGCAAFYGQAELVELLLESGASVNVEGSLNHFNRLASPLVLAATHGDARTVRRLLGAGADPLYVSTSLLAFRKQWTAYEWAVERGHREAASLLKAEMDRRMAAAGVSERPQAGIGGKLGFLKQAVSLAGGFVPGLSQVSGALEKAQTAVNVAETGAAVYRAVRPAGAAPAYAAAAQAAEAAPAPQEPKLHEAADTADVGRLRLLLAGGADVNETCADGATALMHAAAVGSAESVKSLLAAKADANASNADGVTALMAAVLTDRLEAVEAMLAGGADPNLRTRIGGTALSLAEAAGHKEIAASLKKAGAR